MSSSNVGNAQVYEAGDQRNAPESERPKPERNEEGKEGSHKDNDAKDERSIANRLAGAKDQNDTTQGESGKATAEDKLAQQDPTALAKAHGNEPSKGAKIDKELMDDEEEELRKKEEAKKQSEEAKKGKKH